MVSGGFILRASPKIPLANLPFQSNTKQGFVLIADTEYFGSRNRKVSRCESRTRKTHSQVDDLLDFTELVDGDPYPATRVCLFRASPNWKSKAAPEVISVEFANQMTIHVPIQVTFTHSLRRSDQVAAKARQCRQCVLG